MNKFDNIYTYHNSILFFDILNSKIVARKKYEEGLIELKGFFDGEKFYIVIHYGNVYLYIYKFLEDGTVYFSNEKNDIKYLKNNNKKISISTNYGFLSARTDGSIKYKPWNKDWEMFSVGCCSNDYVYNKIELFYWDKKINGLYNVGDVLSKYIVEKMSGMKVVHCTKDNSNKLCAIGSIISSATLESGGTFWGSGSHAKSVDFFASNPKFLAVRGPLTRKMLLDTGYQCPDIYGDPALLLPEFYHKPAASPKYKLGVIGHWRHREKIDCKDGVLFIDILRKEDEITAFIDEICSCEKILSSSLHGIIIANAYGVPARWFMVENFPLEGNPYKKFHDYFMSVDMPIQKPLMLKEHVVIDENNKFDIDMTVDLKINLNDLKDVFPYK